MILCDTTPNEFNDSDIFRDNELLFVFDATADDAKVYLQVDININISK